MKKNIYIFFISKIAASHLKIWFFLIQKKIELKKKSLIEY